MIAELKPLFPLGQCVSTPGALEALARAGQSPAEFLDQHVRGQWGDVCEEDKRANEQALVDGERILSAYTTSLGVKFWVITASDRSSTTILLVEEY